MQALQYDSSWTAIRLAAFPERPHLANEMLPVWSFSAIYAEPDGEVPCPASYLAENGVVEWQATGAGRKPLTDDNRREATRRFYYFGPRHLDHRFRIEHRAAGRDVPRPVSDTYGDPEKDWDHVMAFRDATLLKAGLTDQSPPRDIAYAFAREISDHWRGGGPRQHPADVLTHKAYCLGAANTTVAILESLGIPARGVAVSDHAMCEAFLDGAWRLIDSCRKAILHPPGSDYLLPTDYMALTTDPLSPAHGNRISDFHRGLFYHYPAGHYGIPDGRWIRQSLVEMCPATAIALYPRHSAYRFKTRDPHRIVILDRPIRMLHRYDWGMNLRPGERLREGIYLGDLDGVKSFEFEVRWAHQDGLFPDPAMANDLVLHAGGQTLRLGEAGQWPLRPHHDRTALLSIALPPDLFEPHRVNWLQLENVSKGRIYRFPLVPGILEPYVAPWLPA